jgi:hypothetical protein
MAENLRKEKEIKDFEANKLKELWEQDIKNDLLQKEKKNELNKQVYMEIEEFNKKELDERKRKALEEKNRDRELIDTIIKREKNLDDIDRKEKERKKLEFSENKKYLDYILSKKKEASMIFDKIAQEEQDKQFLKVQANWIKEENERIELLKKVYKNREEAVRLKSILIYIFIYIFIKFI